VPNALLIYISEKLLTKTLSRCWFSKFFYSTK